MTVRVVEGKKPYTGGQAIDIDENKVISLKLRDENNLIIYDEGDDEIYVDLQLPDGIEPLDAFPVGVTTGRVLVADDWDKTGTIICAKTTSGDNIKLLYADDGTLWIDNGTGIFKQLYFKADVDLIISAIQEQIDALSGLGRFLSLWDGETGMPISFPLSTPYEYHTGDWYMINVVDNTTNYRPSGTEFDGTASTTVETVATEIGDVYIYDGTTFLLQKNGGGGGSAVLFSQVLGDPYSNTNLATALNAKQGTLTAGSNITIQSDTISATDTTYTAGTNIQISPSNVISATGGGSDIEYVTQAEYTALLPGAESDGKHYFIYSSSGGGGWQPGANTILYVPFANSADDESLTPKTISSNTLSSYMSYSNDVCTISGVNANGKYITYSLGGADQSSAKWTINIWVNASTSTGSNIIAWTNCGTLSITDSKWCFEHRGSSSFKLYDTTTISLNTWYNLGVVRDGSSVIFYINGTQISSSNNGGGHLTDNNSYLMGRPDGSVNWTFQGKVSEYIYEIDSWTAQEISDYFNQTKANYGIS